MVIEKIIVILKKMNIACPQELLMDGLRRLKAGVITLKNFNNGL